jgi:hypothetical protein
MDDDPRRDSDDYLTDPAGDEYLWPEYNEEEDD